MRHLKSGSLVLHAALLTSSLHPTHSTLNAQPAPNIRNPSHVPNPLVASKNHIHLLNRSAFSFGDEEVHPDDENDAEDEEEIKCAESDGFQHAGCDEGYDELYRKLAL